MRIKPIKGYEGYFEISNNGKVFSCERTIIYKDGRSYKYLRKERKPQSSPKGYLRIELCKNGTCKNYFIQRLVADTFLYNPDPKNLTHVDHRDTNKQNNNYWNLEWITNLENQRRSWANGRKMPKGMNGFA